jgi:DGQHR domain-containing protein
VNELQVPAIALEQAGGKTIYAFGIDGKQVPSFACVSRIKRDDAGNLFGYQRPEVRRHIAEIRRYIESEAPLVPNAVVLAFDSRVAFVPGPPSKGQGPSTTGTLRIPIVDDGDVPGWIVDGQQRVAAIREASVSSFPIFAVAFIAGDEAEQREQFVLVNTTKPLPKTLIYELLPGVRGKLPTAMEERKVASMLVSRLCHDPGSPLKGIVRTTTNPSGRIQATSLIRATENSLRDGVLYRIALTQEDEAVDDAMASTLSQFWSAVRETWADIWDLGPRRSRLVHGAGVVTLGFVMDAIADRQRDGAWPDQAFFGVELQKLRPHCRWNEGYWEFGPELRRRWDELQNTPRDVQVLSNHLLRVYRRL